MLDLIAAAVFTVSLLVMIYAEYRRDKRPTIKESAEAEPWLPGDVTPTLDDGLDSVERAKAESIQMEKELDRFKRARVDFEESRRISVDEYRAPTPAAMPISPSGVSAGSTVSEEIERKASITYWERMCLKEEFDLVVSLHRPEVKVVGPAGSTVEEFDTLYKLPKTGQLRIIPVCSGCNISPSSRDIKVQELDSETRAEFKVLPMSAGTYDLKVEFQFVDIDGSIRYLGLEKVEVAIQPKPIQVNIGSLSISVGRRVPTFFSMCGSLFGFSSFVLARFGVNLQAEIINWSATVSTGLAGAMMILLAMLMLVRGLKPLMKEISIKLKPR